jgi:hypothetical protein
VKDSCIPAVPEALEAATRDIEVAQVLEHISSPYRWELLEFPTAKQNISAQPRLGKKQ